MSIFLLASSCEPAPVVSSDSAQTNALRVETYCEKQGVLGTPLSEDDECAAASDTKGNFSLRFKRPRQDGVWNYDPVDVEERTGRFSDADLESINKLDSSLLSSLGLTLSEVKAEATRHMMALESDSVEARAIGTKTFVTRVVNGLPVFGQRAVVGRDHTGAVTSVLIANWAGTSDIAGDRAAARLRAVSQAANHDSSELTDGLVWTNGQSLSYATDLSFRTFVQGSDSFIIHEVYVDTGRLE